jgi:glycosyltransferase involved in cell wall biosynthesis
LNNFDDYSGMTEIPKTGIVLFHDGAFGGSTKKFANLFFYLHKNYPGRFYLIVNRHVFNQLHQIYGEIPEDYIKIADIKNNNIDESESEITNVPRFYSDNALDPLEIDRQHTLLRKIYWFTKNKNRQRKLFGRIEKIRKELDIKVFYGVFAGILPLVFYLNESPRKAGVIFSDMDSWFTDVMPDMKKLWYRKYYSFNYALENCDLVDFLSPYVMEGVKKLGVKLTDERIRISPCSFIDYTKCSVGEKRKMEIAFSSRLEPDKNPMLYLDAASELLKKYPDIKFHLLGEGTLVKEIKEFIDKNNLKDKIIFQFHKNPPEILKETTIFISLQTGTNYPSQSVLEAMACGNSIIASNRGDTKLFINEQNGILIDINKNRLVTAIEGMIINPGKARALGANARELVMKEHTIERYKDYFLGIIREAAKLNTK